MSKQRKPLHKLTMLDRFLFDTVMSDKEQASNILSIIRGKDIGDVRINTSEKQMEPFYDSRSSRLDLLLIDNDDIVYDAEAQKRNTGNRNIRRRSRYYQSLIDSSLLEIGETDFGKLNDVYIIFISPFDLFGAQKYCYTFVSECIEDKSISLDDGATRIFLYTKGQNDNEVSKDLVDLLHAMEVSFETGDGIQTGNEKIDKLADYIRTLKRDQEVGAKYMKYLEEIALEREEAKQEAIQEERANTERERKRADALEKRADAQEKRADAQEKRADAQEKRAEEAEEKLLRYEELLIKHGIIPD